MLKAWAKSIGFIRSEPGQARGIPNYAVGFTNEKDAREVAMELRGQGIEVEVVQSNDGGWYVMEVEEWVPVELELV